MGKIHQQADFVPRSMQIIQKLSLMYLIQALRCLELHQNQVLDNDISEVITNYVSFVMNIYGNLTLCINALAS